MKTVATNLVEIDRPVRWDHPLDREMLTRDIAWMLALPPFSTMDPNAFPSHSKLEDVIRNDTRILRFEAGDIVVREGDYGGSAFLILRGSVRAFLESLWTPVGRPGADRDSSWKDWLKSQFQKQTITSHDNRRVGGRDTNSGGVKPGIAAPIQKVEVVDGRNRIFLQDINAVIDGYQSEPLGVGEIFGEMAAITRTQHRYTAVANAPSVVLEIRWQGLRILRRDRKFREYLDSRFRETSLQTHLRETPLFRFLDDDTMERVIAETKIESIGDREWFSEYRDTQKLDVQAQIEREPIIANEGKPVEDLILIRAGFARLSFEHGHGHQTVAYLGRGQMFGLGELAHQFRDPISKPLPYQESLRALGFVDLLRIPREIVLSSIFPKVRGSELPKPIFHPRYDAGGLVISDSATNSGLVKSTKKNVENAGSPSAFIDTSLLEFLVDERLINGKQTMLIDLDKCTGCDECVKACASTHHGTPRFVRSGPQFGPLMFAHACMHCTDPVCMIGCPTGAIARDPDTGVIAINANTCIGCKTCSESCPYDNIVMIQVHDQKGRAAIDRKTQLPILQASKCDLCQNLKTGPSCQRACPHDALFRIDTSEAKSIEHWLHRKSA